MANHTPQIELTAARAALAAAYDDCAHWDYESGGIGHECCDRLDEARERVARARSQAR